MKEFNLNLPVTHTVKIYNIYTNEEYTVSEMQIKYLQVLVVKGELDPHSILISSSVYHEDIDKCIDEPEQLILCNGNINPNIKNMSLSIVLNQTTDLSLELIKLQRGAK